MTALDQLRPLVGVKQACQALSVPRALWYRRRRRRLTPWPVAARRHSPRALSENEQSAVLACLHEERFQDYSPAQVYAALLDEGRFHCSIRTMYRLLETHVKTHSRPHVSDDNPYSESQFRTLKYRPGFPDRFGSIEDARGFCQSFFQRYKVHHGQAAHILAHRPSGSIPARPLKCSFSGALHSSWHQ
jgi:hypothetical protein